MMGEFLRRNPILAALAAVAVLLAVALALEFVVSRPGGPAGPARRVAAADAKLLPPLVPVAPEQVYPETSARPLFTPTRRLAPEAVATQQPTFQRGQFVLLGVTIAGDTRIAMLREKSSGRLHRIARGGEVNGIKVAAVEPESVTLAMGAEQESLPLTVQRPGAPGQPAQPGQPVIPPASATLQGPFGPATAAAPVAHAPAAPTGAPPGFGPGPSPGGFPVPTNSAMPAQGPIPSQGAVPTPPLTSAAPQGADPNAGLSPEEILARRRARRAQQTQ